MDPTYPQSQIKEIVEEATPVAIITAHGSADHLPDFMNRLVINLDSDWLEKIRKAEISTAGVPIEVDLDDLAFIPFSSGTTGKPKGDIEHYKYALLEIMQVGNNFVNFKRDEYTSKIFA